MNRKPVISSNIRSMGHDPRENVLEVEFVGGQIHRYSDVNVDEHKALLNAKSIGSHFHNNVRHKPNRKVEPE